MKGLKMLEYISWLALAFSLFGNVLIAQQKRSGFTVWIVSNALWIIVNIVGTPNIPQILMYIVYSATNIYGFMNWKQTAKNA